MGCTGLRVSGLYGCLKNPKVLEFSVGKNKPMLGLYLRPEIA